MQSICAQTLQAAQRILAEVGATPVALVARYATGYSHIFKQLWWDIEQCGGPMVEQVVTAAACSCSCIMLFS